MSLERAYYKPKKGGKKHGYHTERFPSTYCNPNEIWANQKNPYTNQYKPWKASITDDPVTLMLQHITEDSWFTIKLLGVSNDWLHRAADGSLTNEELMPGTSKYLRLVNDTAERLVRAAEDTRFAYSVVHFMK